LNIMLNSILLSILKFDIANKFSRNSASKKIPFSYCYIISRYIK
jgi:hypothetical protein